MERLYFVGAKSPKTGHTPPSAPVTPAADTPTDQESRALGKDYLSAITRQHGSTMKHLLLSDQWPLVQDEISDLVRYCPNLEQLGLAIGNSGLEILRILVPFLPKLHTIRILANEWSNEFWQRWTMEQHRQEMEVRLEKAGAHHIRYFGIGDNVFHAGGSYQDQETGEWRRDVKEITREDVKHIEIFGLDALDISLEPIAPFSP